MLDQNELAKGREFSCLRRDRCEPQRSDVVYLEDLTAFREYTLYVKDLASGKIVDSIKNVWNGPRGPTTARVLLHDARRRQARNASGATSSARPREQDVRSSEDDVLNNVSVFRSRSGKFVFIRPTVHLIRVAGDSNGRAEQRRRAGDSLPARQRRISRRPRRHDFLIVTNDDARNFRVMGAPDTDGARPAGRTSCASYRRVRRSIDVFSADLSCRRARRPAAAKGDGSRDRRLPSRVVSGDRVRRVTGSNAEYDTDTVRFSYSSLVTPSSTFDYNMATRRAS